MSANNRKPQTERNENPRKVAVQCAMDVAKRQLLVPEAMALSTARLSDEDRNLAYEIVYGTYRYLPGLQKLLGSYCKTGKLHDAIKWLLLTSLYQLKYMRVPDYAVLDEANKLAVALRFKGLKPLVNGVLRNALRSMEQKTADWQAKDWLLPDWLADLLTKQYGTEMVEQWLETWEQRGSLAYWSAADNALPGDAACEGLPHGWLRANAIPAEAYETHRLYAQNESSQAVAEMACRLAPKTVLDLCASPGGKACYIAAFGQVERLVANDNAKARVARLRENKERLGLEFEISLGDGRELTGEPYDLVLLDAPCSGIGIIGRHPEIKHLKREAAPQNLRTLQSELLDAAWRMVKPGGYLLYTVCSLDRRELPEIPADAQVQSERFVAEMSQLPCRVQDHHFYFSPTSRFDGFRGMLLHKA